jgi:hypothetical protein
MDHFIQQVLGALFIYPITEATLRAELASQLVEDSQTIGPSLDFDYVQTDGHAELERRPQL